MGWRHARERCSPFGWLSRGARPVRRLRGHRPIAVVSGVDCDLPPGRRRQVIVDPGFVPSPASILEPLRDRGVSPQDVTDVIFSHHHPDHTLNAALFPNARVHDHWAIYRNDTWQMRPAEGFELSGSIRLIETPGHTPQDVTTLVGTAEGVIALTHLWWTRQGPAEDPFASDSAGIHVARARVLDIAGMIIPGHGAPFTPDASTPR